MHVVLRADGGPEIGYGHLVRSGALAETLLNRGHAVTFATTTPKHVTDVCPDAVATVQLPSRDNPRPFTEWLDSVTPDAVFTDAYPVDTDYQLAIRHRVPLVVLQDDARHAVCADMFVNGNLYAPNLTYDYVTPEPRTFLGTDYVLLRQEIRDWAAHEPPWRDLPERALITMGGSDTANLTPTAIRAFDGLDIRVDAIIGPGFSKQQERTIRDIATEVSVEVNVARDPDDLPERMFQSDFAVCTASSTTYELLALGTPIVCCPVVANQELIAEALGERDMAIVIDRNSESSPFRKGIERCVEDSPLRQRLFEKGRVIIDGRGTERTTDALLELIS